MNKTSIFLMVRIIIIFCIVFYGFVYAPNIAHASGGVLVNEIAWMGNSASANAEWIELYNNSDEEVSLDGWILKAIDGAPTINLVGTLSARGYFLLERTSDETVPGISASQIYSGSLGNTGEHLELINNNGEIVDSLDFVEGWPAGDNTTKESMQRNASGWITAPGTPGVVNSTVEAENVETVTNGSSSTSSTNLASTDKKASSTSESIVLIDPDPKYTAKIETPDYGVVGSLLPIKASVVVDKKKDLVTGRFEWYLGDGTVYRYYKNTDMNHAYEYPGDYQIVLEYYSNSMKDKPDSIHKKNISIIPDDIGITGITEQGGIIITNDSTREIDLEKWTLQVADRKIVLHRYTVVRKGKTLTLPKSMHGLEIGDLDSVELISPVGTIVSTFQYAMLSE